MLLKGQDRGWSQSYDAATLAMCPKDLSGGRHAKGSLGAGSRGARCWWWWRLAGPPTLPASDPGPPRSQEGPPFAEGASQVNSGSLVRRQHPCCRPRALNQARPLVGLVMQDRILGLGLQRPCHKLSGDCKQSRRPLPGRRRPALSRAAGLLVTAARLIRRRLQRREGGVRFWSGVLNGENAGKTARQTDQPPSCHARRAVKSVTLPTSLSSGAGSKSAPCWAESGGVRQQQCRQVRGFTGGRLSCLIRRVRRNCWRRPMPVEGSGLPGAVSQAAPECGLLTLVCTPCWTWT